MKLLVLAPRFWSLFLATALGAFADNALRNATILAIFAVAAVSAGEADFTLPAGLGAYAGALVSMGFTLPIFLFSGLAGQFADAVDRRRLVTWLKCAEVGLMAFATLAFVLGNALVLLFALFLMGTQSAFFSPVRNALMPHYYSDEELPRANGYFNAALFVAIVAGLGLGGYFINKDGGRTVVSAILVGAALLGALATLALPPAPPCAQRRPDLNIVRVGIQAFRETARTRGLVLPMLGVGWFWLVNAALLAILPNLVRDTFSGGEDGLTFAFVLSGLGAGLGSIAGGLLTREAGEGFTLSGTGVLGMTLAGLVVYSLAQGYEPAAAGFVSSANAPLLGAIFAVAFFNGVFVVPMLAALQGRAPVKTRATVMAAANMTNGGMATLGAAAILPALAYGVTPDAVVLGIAGLQAALLVLMIARRRATPLS